MYDKGFPESPAGWYALRRSLPQWRFDELLDEMIRVLPGCKAVG